MRESKAQAEARLVHNSSYYVLGAAAVEAIYCPRLIYNITVENLGGVSFNGKNSRC